MPSLTKNKSKSLKTKKVALKNGHKNGPKNGIKVSAKTAISEEGGEGVEAHLLLRRRQGRRHEGDEEPARRQGREPRRDGQHRPAGSSRVHDHHRGLHRVLRGRQEAAEGAGRRHARVDRAMEKVVGAKFGDAEEPAAGFGPLGRARVDARHDGHDPEPRAQRQDRGGAGREVGQRALRLRQLPSLRRDVRRRRARAQAGEQGGSRSVRRDPGEQEEGAAA